MFGLQFIKFQPNVYAIHYSKGRVRREGPGLSFFYYAPNSSLVSIPLTSIEAPFIFEEVTADYQAITIQGLITYHITNPVQIARLMNFTLDKTGRSYSSDDPQKLPQRIINTVQVLIRQQVLGLPLRQVLKSADRIMLEVLEALRSSSDISSLGLEILSLVILGIRPNKDTARALEAEAREQILKEADDAIYRRRNASVEQERTIKENELNTEIAVENKKRQIREAQLDAEEAVQSRKHRLQATEMGFKIDQEAEKKKLVELAQENARIEADAKAYALSATVATLKDADPALIQALANLGMKPEQIIALAFQGIASKAEKIGQLNITPDLLKELLEQPK